MLERLDGELSYTDRTWIIQALKDQVIRYLGLAEWSKINGDPHKKYRKVANRSLKLAQKLEAETERLSA